MSTTIYKKLSEERKAEQAAGVVPEWVSTAGYQMFKEKYLYDAENMKEQFERIARTAAKHLPKSIRQEGNDKFFELLWNGWLSASTPVLANMGTDRGLPVSCSGSVIGDSIHDFYDAAKEAALLTKHGFGTSSYLGNIRHRGSPISTGGVASGVVPVFRHFVSIMQDVSQAGIRRGSWAGYLPIDHGDFDELADWVKDNPDDANVGWNISYEFIDRLKKGHADSTRRYKKALKLKMLTGKGYFCKIDEMNKKNPQMYIDKGLSVKASNLCSEISLFADEEHTFTCVLSSMNIAKYDEWKDTDAVFWATVFLDCVCSEFIERARNIRGLEKAVRATEKGRALGLGAMGLHTLFQKRGIPFEDIRAFLLNTEIFKHIEEESSRASRYMAEEFGEPEWCEGYGVRNTHLTAIAPNKSSALLMGGVSEGINPDPAIVYSQTTASGEVFRINQVFLDLMKSRGKYKKSIVNDISEKFGSVQHLDWLTDEEKMVFRTAFEINQESIVNMGAVRQNFISQSQSLNLFFSSEESEKWISHIHKLSFENNIKALYYITTMTGVQPNRDCIACEG